jgi:hypothetical protein
MSNQKKNSNQIKQETGTDEEVMLGECSCYQVATGDAEADYYNNLYQKFTDVSIINIFYSPKQTRSASGRGRS